ncbi:MAG TPA: DoxX family protein [Caulobacteraceae bacterium]|jgi:putative oxidoreductase
MLDLVFLTPLRRFSDLGLLLLRLMAGAFLVWGVWDNITSTERMAEFVAFLAKFHFPAPEVMAPLSVLAQFTVGLAFVTGLFTRWAGVVCAVNFLVAIAMVDRFGGVRGSFPSACLVCIGLYLAAHGSGRFGLDRVFERSDHRRRF